ncbi:3471_t:CDS:2 [Funneliformis geosporum]|uniref:3471_t:CDS:1 n=1 Tax=Funneliformis geosporum TaxID=1117311 RepID=A0A9W4SBK6_9GLOM|nr:3471_t:CDS:2 [Funneliformis geosporum]
MAIENKGLTERINGTYLIWVFFDILVLDDESSDECEIKIRDIYLVVTSSRKTAIKAVQDNNFETASDDLYSFHHKWKYRGKIGAKSENDFVKKYPVKALEEGEENPEEKEYMGGPIKIKISTEDDFTSSLLKLPVKKKGSLKFFLQKCGLYSKADMPYDKIMKIQKLLEVYAVKRDIIISTSVPENIEKGKYPSVYIFSPKKGIERFEAKALKGICEHFLCESGNSLSPIFLHKLACRTTIAGKDNLNLVAEFVSKKGFGIKYGDTDSLYLTCLDRYYEKCDEAFSREEIFKVAYWTEIVKITINVMRKLCDQNVLKIICVSEIGFNKTVTN